MKIRIKAEGINLWLPVPLCLGNIAIHFAIRDQISNEHKKLLLQTFNVCKKELKKYKGMRIVEVHTSNGEHITVTL